MFNHVRWPALWAALLVALPLRAANDAQFAAIAQLAGLNATALHCHYLDQTQRIKAALVDTLPKKRHLGEYFDAKTNMAFMDIISRREGCPDKSGFLTRVADGIARLQAVFSTQ